EEQVIETSPLGPVTVGFQVDLKGGQLAILDSYPDVSPPGPGQSGLDSGVSTYVHDVDQWVLDSRSSPFARSGSAMKVEAFEFDVDRILHRTSSVLGVRRWIEERRVGDRYVTESSTSFEADGALSLEQGRVAMIGEFVAVAPARTAPGAPWIGEVHLYSTRPRNMQRYCGAALPCQTCPCNGASFAQPLAGCVNSDSRAGTIETVGRARLTADSFGIRARGLTSNTMALLLVGTTRLPQGSANCTTTGLFDPGFGLRFSGSNGLRCVGGFVRRAGIRVSDANGAIGHGAGGTPGWGASDTSPQSLASLLSASSGQELHFQIYYRDASPKSCGASINTTDATSVTYLP
ncbi:MAG: hypothetical protein AAF368_08800, partial [Planctomycetota bacterium]